MPKCRSCRAEIVWALTDAGRRMPVDVEPNDAGNVIFTSTDPWARKVRVLTKAELDDPQGLPPGRLFMPHWATCPNAPAHKK